MNKSFKRMTALALSYLYYPYFRSRYYKICSIDETIDYMSVPGHSIVRFGDGEFSLINGKSLSDYQCFSECLRKSLIAVLRSENPNLLVCLPGSLKGLSSYTNRTKNVWVLDFFRNRNVYLNYIDRNRTYGDSFVSRPYMNYKDKTQSNKWFSSIIKIFDDQNVVIIEGRYSRVGVGNDLLSSAKSVKRIVCPSNNAFNFYNDILNVAKEIDLNSLVLVSLGPTGKVLTMDLTNLGYWVLDIGHLDGEYEWLLSHETDKAELLFKHTPEKADVNIQDVTDPKYYESIISVIGE